MRDSADKAVLHLYSREAFVLPKVPRLNSFLEVILFEWEVDQSESWRLNLSRPGTDSNIKVMIREEYGIDMPDCVFSSERFKMEMAIDYLERKWGDAEKYFLDAAVSEEDIRIVKSMLVD